MKLQVITIFFQYAAEHTFVFVVAKTRLIAEVMSHLGFDASWNPQCLQDFKFHSAFLEKAMLDHLLVNETIPLHM